MSRFHLVISFLLLGNFVFGQGPLKKIIKAGDKQFELGDYNSAIDFYEKARIIDSTSVEILWKCAESYRMYRDYQKARVLYTKVYKKEEGFIYPMSLLYRGLMEKQTGDYETALVTFKTAAKKYRTDKNSYAYLKAKNEISSCTWAKNHYENRNLLPVDLPEGINSKDAEFAHTILEDQLIFSSLKSDSTGSLEEVYDTSYHVQLYISSLFYPSKQRNEIADLRIRDKNVGNGSFSADGKRFYFSYCDDLNSEGACSILIATYENDSWKYVDSLGEIINLPKYSQTMPRTGMLDGKEVLFFSSNNPGSKGGYDLWYSEIENGDRYYPPVPITSINTFENETSPYWDDEEQRLYFSTTWYDGLGGYDIFYSEYKDGEFSAPRNLGAPFNSPANDLYYFKKDSLQVFSSNRLGVEYAKNPTCCSDIFMFREKPITMEPPTEEETLEEMSRRLPITLYFHNDEPNPKTRDTTTNVNYFDSYTAYRDMLNKYQKEYSKGLKGDKAEEAKEDIESFFIEYVDQGVKDLQQFQELLLEELDKGRAIELTIKGYASPLAKSDYNVNLTKRRIWSLINYLNEYGEGEFSRYIDKNQLTFKEVPFGEYVAGSLVSDNLNDQKNSVYSRAAGLERKIEIQSVSFIKDTIMEKVLETESQLRDLGIIPKTDVQSIKYTITNTNDHSIEIDSTRVPCHCSTLEIAKRKLAPGESTEVIFTFDPAEYAGQKFVKSVYIKTKDATEELRLIITGTVSP